MTNIERIVPVIEDGIEFFVSADGTKTGMSLSGLSRLCGISRNAFRTSPFSFVVDSDSSEAPENLPGMYIDLIGIKGQKIVPSVTCAAIIEYYAFDSKNANDTAKYSFRRFAVSGIDNWIRRMTGAVEDRNDGQILSLLQEVLSEVKELRQISTEYKAIREKTSTYMPGADQLLDEISTSTPLLEPCEDGSMSLEAWLKIEKHITTDKSTFHRLANIVADSYKSLMKKDPEKRHFKYKEGDKWKTKYNVSVYEPIAFPILQIAFNKVFGF